MPDAHLISCWELMRQRKSVGSTRPELVTKGIMDLMNSMRTETGTIFFIIEWKEMRNTIPTSCGFVLATYSSKYRTSSLDLCGSPYGDLLTTVNSSYAIEKAKARGDLQEAAALAFLKEGNIEQSVDILTSSSDEKLILLAAALTGSQFQTDGRRALCQKLSAQNYHPYLRVIFGLLATQGDWKTVLESRDLPFVESVALALVYMCNEELHPFVHKWTKQLVIQGRLDGLLLTGFTNMGFELFQTYIDATSDVQTIALLLCANGCKISPEDQRMKVWIEK